MADDINKVILIGRLVRDSELLYTSSGFALCKFDLAVNRRRKQGEQWVDEVSYFSINVWGRRGESLHSYLAKGNQVGIEGALRQERWEQDGLKRSKITIDAVNVELLGGNRDGSGSSGGGQGGRTQGPNSQRSGQQVGARGASGGHQGAGRGKPGGQQGGQGRGNNQSRPSQGGGPNSFESYTPPENPGDYQDYEDDIPF